MKRATFLLLLLGLMVSSCLARPVDAWVAYRGYGAYGGVAVGGGGVGAYHGAYGGSAAWSHGSGSAYGTYGGSASWSDGSGSATGRYGGSASWSR
jgi:hypothetical protein